MAISDYTSLSTIRYDTRFLVAQGDETYAISFEDLEKNIKAGKLTANFGEQYRGKMLVVGPNGVVRPLGAVLKSMIKVTENGTYNAIDHGLDCFDYAVIDVPNLDAKLDTKLITTNGTYSASNDGLDGYSGVVVSVVKSLGDKTITDNGVYYASDDGVDGYGRVVVQASYRYGNITLSSNGTYYASTSGLSGFSTVEVNVPSPDVGEFTITSNGTYHASAEDYEGYSKVTVNIPLPSISDKVVSFNGTYIASDDGLVGYGKVTVTNTDYYDLIDGTISVCSDNSINVVNSYAFMSCNQLREINLPNCVMIGESAFANCKMLSSVSLPVCSTIAQSAFRDCGLIEISTDSWVTINNGAFIGNTSLTTVTLQSCRSIGDEAFLGCTSLSSVSMPVCSSFGVMAFNNCGLTEISLPLCDNLAHGMLMNNKSLSAIYLLSNHYVNIGYNALDGTPMQYSSYLGYYGSIYVPSRLVSEYKSAAAWRLYWDRIVAYS